MIDYNEMECARLNRMLAAVRGYFRSTSLFLWMFCLCASCLSAMLVYSATRTNGMRTFITQVAAISIGYVGAVILSLFDYKTLAKLWPVIAVGCLGLFAVTSIFGYTVPGTDDKAWIRIGSISFQPSEMVKIGFIVTLAKHLDVLREKNKLRSFGHICLLLGHAMIPMAIIHMQGDDGAALVFLFIFLVMAFGAGVQLRYFALFGAAVAAAVPLAWKFVLNDDQKMRFRILLNHDLDPLHYGYQQSQGLISIGSGKLFGRGYLKGPRVAAGIVPEDHNDFIYTVVGEEFGFVGCIVVILILLAIVIAILRVGLRTQDALGKNICYGFMGLVAFQAISNIGMCLYVLPVVGITLPFFSAGGSSAACLYFGVGLVQSVSRHRVTAPDMGMLAGE